MSLAVSFSSYACSLLVLFASVYLLGKRKPSFPVINGYAGDFFKQRAYSEYHINAKQLLADASARYGPRPFALLVPHAVKIILPPSMTDWVKKNRNLDHQQLVRDEFFASYPGFEAQYVLHHPNRMVINMVQAKLSKNDRTLPVLNESLTSALSDIWGDSKEWNRLEWENGTTGIISRVAASVFVGPELAGNPEWQSVTRGYVLNFFAAVSELQTWHPWLRRLVHWYLPGPSACRAGVKQTRAMVEEVVRKRRERAEVAEAHGQEAPEYNDALAWTLEDPNVDGIHPGDVQLSLSMASLFTTVEVLRQVLIDVTRQPELMATLREEIGGAISDHGLTAAALFKMELLDSVMKESQRLIPALIGFERVVANDTQLPDGTTLQRGTHIAVDSCDMWSPDVYAAPNEYDGWRFLKRRKAGAAASQFVQSSREHNAFGGGRHQCPGRFFAGNELKLCLAQILLNYEFRLEDGYTSKPVQVGFITMVDPSCRMEVRRR